MAEGDTFRVNGNVHGWGGIKLKLKNARYYGAVEVTYADKLERVEAAGMGRHHAPNRRSPGKYTCDPSKIKFFKESAEIFRSALAAEAEDGRSYGTVEFEAVIQFIEPGGLPMQVELRRCTWTEDAGNHAESADPLFDETTIKPMYIVRNGKTLFDSSEGMP
jgi:hypothetical protein